MRAGRWLAVSGAVLLSLISGTPALAAAPAVPPPPPVIAGTAAILENLTTGQVLYAKNPNLPLAPASITKIMTALVALRYGPPLAQMISVPAAAYHTPGSTVYLVPGQRMTFGDLLYGLILRSGNDAAVAVAILTAGSVKRFVAMMNATCHQLGCTGTTFKNPDGLPAAGHLVTAHDMALITRAAMASATFRRIVATRTWLFPGFPSPVTLVNEDQMLWRYPGAIGVKIGWTTPAGETIVSVARRNGITLVAVVLHSIYRRLWADPTALLNWGFANFRQVPLVRQGQVVATVTVAGQAEPVVADQSLSWLLPAGQSVGAVQTRLVVGPASHGRGVLAVAIGGQSLGTVPVSIATGVSRTPGWRRPAAVLLLTAVGSWMVWPRRRQRRRWRRRVKRNAGEELLE
ncbi:MAG: D-alanyl-D-alanine carboxypeptidase family protein [Sulfobacillus sp.]